MQIFTLFASVALKKKAALHVNSSSENWEFLISQELYHN